MKEAIKARIDVPVTQPSTEGAEICLQNANRSLDHERTVKEIRTNGTNKKISAYSATQLEHDFSEFKKVMEYLGEPTDQIDNFSRLEEHKATNTSPRTVLVQFSSIWNVRKVLAKTPKLKDYTIPLFISKSLTPTEQATENNILIKRRQLIDRDANRKDGKLFNSGIDVPSCD